MAAPQITPLPTPPVRSDAPADFSSKADAFAASLPQFVTETNASAAFVDQRAIDADASATAAAASEAAVEADRAEVATNTATVASNTATVVARADEVAANTLQVAADTQQVATDAQSVADALASIAGGPVYSVNGMTGDVTLAATDIAPAATQEEMESGTETAIRSMSPLGVAQAIAANVKAQEYFHARDEKPSGTGGGASVAGDQVRTLNTVKTNTIPGAALVNSSITLPAGTYRVSASSPTIMSNGAQAWIEGGSGAVLIVGSSAFSISTDRVNAVSIVKGVLTLGTETAIRLVLYAVNPDASGLGIASGSGNEEIYSEIEIWKVA